MTDQPITIGTRTWQRWALEDSRLRTVAMTIDLPSDWLVSGGVAWEGKLARPAATLSNRNGNAFVQFHPYFSFVWPGNLGQADGYGNVALPPQPVAKQLAEFVVRLLRPQAQNLRILQVEPLDPRVGFPVGVSWLRSGYGLDAASMQLTYLAGGRLWREELRAFGIYPPPVQLPMQTMVAHNIVVIGLAAALDQFDAELDTMRRIALSGRLEPAWEDAVNRNAQQADQQAADTLASMRYSSFMDQQQADQRLMQGYSDLRATQTQNLNTQFDHAMSGPAYSGPGWTGPSAQDAAMDAALMGRAAVADPNSAYGNVQYVDSGAAVVWQNERGEVIETDDVSLDPRINSHDTWQVVRRYGQ